MILAPGDILAIAGIAYKTLEKCKSSTAEHQDLSGDIRCLHITLEQTGEFWEHQRAQGRDLADVEKERLGTLKLNCEEVFEDVDKMLKKHASLSQKARLKDRMKWIVQDIGPIRNRIILRAMMLAQFNQTVIAASAAGQQEKNQAQILEALTKMHCEHNQGLSKPVPAFSRMTKEDLGEDENEMWTNVIEDLASQGVPEQTVHESQDYIRRWINDVILPESEKLEDDESLSPISKDRETISSNLSYQEPFQSEVQSSTREEHEASDGRSVSEMLTEIFVRWKFSKLTMIPEDLAHDPEFRRKTDRIFDRLDWNDRNSLSRKLVKRELDDIFSGNLLRTRDASDINFGRRISIDLSILVSRQTYDRQAFPFLLAEALYLFQKLEFTALKGWIKPLNAEGYRVFLDRVMSLLGGRSSEETVPRWLLPFGWELQSSLQTPVPLFVSCIYEAVKPTQDPGHVLPDLHRYPIAMNVYAALDHCVPLLIEHMDRIASSNTAQARFLEHRDIVRNVLNAVTECTHFAHLTDVENGIRTRTLDALDKIMIKARYVDVHVLDLRTTNEIVDFARRFQIMVSWLLGFVHRLTSPDRQDDQNIVNEDPIDQRISFQEHVQCIEILSMSVYDSKTKIFSDECRPRYVYAHSIPPEIHSELNRIASKRAFQIQQYLPERRSCEVRWMRVKPQTSAKLRRLFTRSKSGDETDSACGKISVCVRSRFTIQLQKREWSLWRFEHFSNAKIIDLHEDDKIEVKISDEDSALASNGFSPHPSLDAYTWIEEMDAQAETTKTFTSPGGNTYVCKLKKVDTKAVATDAFAALNHTELVAAVASNARLGSRRSQIRVPNPPSRVHTDWAGRSNYVTYDSDKKVLRFLGWFELPWDRYR